MRVAQSGRPQSALTQSMALLQPEDAMRLAVGDVYRPILRDEDPVRALQPAQNGGNNASLQVDSADGVTLRVREIQTVVRRPCDALRPRQLRLFRRTSIAGVAGFARSRYVVNTTGLRVDPVHRVALAQHQIELAVRRDG